MGFFGELFGGDRSFLTGLKTKEFREQQARENNPALQLPAPPPRRTIQEALQSGVDFAKQQTPLAFGARESGLADLLNPQATQQFFEGFQPTSFEQALANQSFANIAPDIERSINQQVSLRGLEGSKLAPQLIAEQRGKLGVDIGNILAQLGQRRGEQSLNARLGIDPISQIVGPIAQQDLNQSNLQSDEQFQIQLAQALSDFQNENAIRSLIQKESQQDIGQFSSSLGSLAGGTLGLFLGGPGGAALGSSLGGSAGGSIGGFFGGGQESGQSPVGLGDALSVFQSLQGGTGGSQGKTGGFVGGSQAGNTTFGIPGQSSTQSVFDFPSSVASGIPQSIFNLVP